MHKVRAMSACQAPGAARTFLPMRFVSLAVVAIIAACPALAADLPCTTLLDRRVLDLRDTRRIDERVTHLRGVLCLAAYADIEDLRRLDSQAGGAIGPALRGFGYRGDGLSWRLARERLCSSKPRIEEAFKDNFVALRGADRGLMEAFNACLPTAQGIEVWVELAPDAENGWLLTAFNRHPQTPRAPRFHGLATSPRDLCTVDSGFVVGQPFRDDRASCRYAPRGNTSVTVRGDGQLGNVTIDVPR
jgi:hypothetical protein